MDISVSRLNHRLALQLPVELPLGLVFVTGAVGLISPPSPPSTGEGAGEGVTWLELSEGGYKLTCRLGPRVAQEVSLTPGQRIRAGGHLIFDVQQAHYYLLARDVELVEPEVVGGGVETAVSTGRNALPPSLADLLKRAEAAQLTPAEMPIWVQRLAPPEVKRQQATEVAPVMPPIPVTTEKPEAEDTAVSPTPVPILPELNATLVHFLSEAMEDLRDVELTPEVLEEIAPGSTVVEDTLPHPEPDAPDPYEVPAATPIPHPHPLTVTPQSRRETDWLVILLIATFILLLMAVVIAIWP